MACRVGKKSRRPSIENRAKKVSGRSSTAIWLGYCQASAAQLAKPKRAVLKRMYRSLSGISSSHMLYPRGQTIESGSIGLAMRTARVERFRSMGHIAPHVELGASHGRSQGSTLSISRSPSPGSAGRHDLVVRWGERVI